MTDNAPKKDELKLDYNKKEARKWEACRHTVDLLAAVRKDSGLDAELLEHALSRLNISAEKFHELVYEGAMEWDA